MSKELIASEELMIQPMEDYLMHYRKGGEKRGVRRYQNEDGSLTPLGRIHYGVGLGRDRSLTKGNTGFVLGNRLVNDDGGLTKAGVRKIEEAGKDGYMNPSDNDRKHGRAKHRIAIIEQMNKESDEKDPKREAGNNIHSVGKDVFEKYKDKYAEATLQDLELPVNEKNKGIIKDTFSKYDITYDWDNGNLDQLSFEKLGKEYGDRWNKRFKNNIEDKTSAEIEKDITNSIREFNEKTQAAKEERKRQNEERKNRLKNELDEIRSLADEELDKRIERLQKEKRYSELLNERANREQSPLHAMASKLFKEAAEKLARRSLDMATDAILNKARNSMNGHKSENNNGNSNENNGEKKDNSGNQSGGNGKFSKAEKTRIRSMADSGKSIADIAKALGVTEDKVKGFMKSDGITIS